MEMSLQDKKETLSILKGKVSLQDVLPFVHSMRRCFPIPCSLCFSHCFTPAPSTYHSGWGGPFLKQLRKGLPRGRADEDGQCSSDSGHTGECECCRAYCSYTSAPLSCREWEMGWTVALETRMWHMCTWGTPLDSTTSSSTLTKREQGPAASSPWPGPTTWPSKPVSGETPSMFSCLHKLPSHSWMETRVGSGRYSQHGTQGHLIPVLPFPQGPWRKYMKQLLLEPFMLGRSFPLVKITWSLASQQAELRARHWVDQCLEEKSLHFPSSPGGDQSWQLSSIYSAQFRCPV